MTTPNRECAACETGTVKPTNLRGRAFDYRDEFGLVFDADLMAPVCDTCGEMFLKSALTRQLGSTLDRLRLVRKRSAVERFVQAADRNYPDVPRAVWEDAFGLSRGYLSRLISGTRVADTALEVLLEGFAREPATVLRLLELAGHVPPGLAGIVKGRGKGRARA
jgi:hypothetical protein